MEIKVLGPGCAKCEQTEKDDIKKSNIPPVPTPGLVTMLDLGAHKCIPCKIMAPIIAELQTKYAGRASIFFIDVWEHREQAQRFGTRGFQCVYSPFSKVS